MAVDKIVWKIVLDFLALCIVAIPLLLLLLWGRPYERGYFESDDSIRYPFVEETISEGLLAGVGFGLIVITVLITEIVRDKRGSGAGEKFLGGRLLPGWVWESYGTIGVFTFGAACQQLTANAAKYAIGRLRPHFYDVCRPLPLPSDRNNLGYIVDFRCTGSLTDQYAKEARLSFPSAHSSFAMYTAVFFIFYIQVKGKWRGSKLLRHLAQFAVLLGAWYVGLSRVVEFKHHWSDVGAGFLIGALFGVLVFVFVLKPKKYGLPSTWQDPPLPTNQLPRAALSR